MAKLGILLLGQVCYLQLIIKVKVPIAGTGCKLQLNSKLGVPLLGQVFAIYSFPKLWVTSGTRANHAAVGRFTFRQHHHCITESGKFSDPSLVPHRHEMDES